MSSELLILERFSSSSRANGRCFRHLKRTVWWSRQVGVGLVCQGTKPHTGLAWQCGYLFGVFSPTGPWILSAWQLTAHHLGDDAHRGLAHHAAFSASSLNGYSNSFLYRYLFSVEDTMLWPPICNHSKLSSINSEREMNQRERERILITYCPKELGGGLSSSPHDL